MNAKAKSFLFSIIAILMGFLIVIIALEIGLRFFPVFSGMPVNRDSAIYSFMPNTTIQRSMHWNMMGARKRQVNNVGFISDQTYEVSNQAGASKPLIAIIGDSYIEAMQVNYANTTEAHLLKTCSDQARVYSFGAQFAPLSQYLSWVRYVGATFAPQAMVVNIVGNDFDESLLSHQMATGAAVPGMQFFDFSSQPPQLVVVPFKSESLITRALRHSALAQYLVRNVGVVNLWKDYRQQWLAPSTNGAAIVKEGIQQAQSSLTASVQEQEVHDSQSEFVGNAKRAYDEQKLQLSKKAVDEFLKRLPALANLPSKSIVLSVDAERPQIYTAQGRQDLDSFFSVMRNYFITQARVQGFQVVDLRPAMIAQYDRTGERFEFADDNHWNATGHQLLANQLLQAPPIASLCNSPKSIR